MERVTDAWNRLPGEIVRRSMVNGFKHAWDNRRQKGQAAFAHEQSDFQAFSLEPFCI